MAPGGVDELCTIRGRWLKLGCLKARLWAKGDLEAELAGIPVAGLPWASSLKELQFKLL